MLLAAVVHYLLARRVTAPWIFTDELIYSELAKSLADTGHFLVRGQTADVFTLYPVLIAPAYLAKSVATAYGIAKVINVVVMTLAAVPVYLWGRRLVSPGHALLATALTLLLPGFLYTGMLMTENAYFPAFLLAVFMLALALERPTAIRQVLVLAAVALAAGIRVQGVVLGLVVPSAIVFKIFLDLRAEPVERPWREVGMRLRQYALIFGLMVLAGFAYVVRAALNGTSLSRGIGSYDVATKANYSFADAGRWIVYHLGELSFSVGFLPAVAFIVLAGLACRARNPSTAAERAFLATTAAALLWVIPQVALYASRFSFRVEERNMFSLSPLLLLALVIWLARGMPRPYGLSIVALVIPAALFSTLPLETFFNVTLVSDTFGMIPLLRLSTLATAGTNDVRIALAGSFIAGVVLFALLPKATTRAAVPVAVGGFLLLSSYSIANAVAAQARSARAFAGPNPSWVDDAAGSGANAAFLYAGDAVSNPHLLWQAQFWNRSVRRVYTLDSDEPGSLATEPVKLGTGGRILPAAGNQLGHPRYLVVDRDFDVDGEIVATGGVGLALYRVRDPLRLASSTDGISADGWIAGSAAYTRFATPGDAPGLVDIDVSRQGWAGPDLPGHVSVVLGTLVTGPDGRPKLGRITSHRTWVIHSRVHRTFRLPTPRPPFRAEVRVDPTFSPSQYGYGDTRQLGAQVAFRFVPSAR